MSKRTANCPNCGAPIEFLWSSAVQTTCPFCKTILVRHDVDLEKVGVVGDLPPDFSPIQIGTEGIFQKKSFVVIGRIIYEYARGTWNEWHLMFNDGASGWLADAQLEYAVSFLRKPPDPLPQAKNLDVGHGFNWFGAFYTVTTITEAGYVGVEGELPFQYWDKTMVRFADLRTADARFATIDYSEETPLLFIGHSVDFPELQLKNVRRFENW